MRWEFERNTVEAVQIIWWRAFDEYSESGRVYDIAGGDNIIRSGGGRNMTETVGVYESDIPTLSIVSDSLIHSDTSHTLSRIPPTLFSCIPPIPSVVSLRNLSRIPLTLSIAFLRLFHHVPPTIWVSLLRRPRCILPTLLSIPHSHFGYPGCKFY